MSTHFKWSFHYLRAFAIVNIIFVHAWRIPENNSINPIHIDIFREVLFHDSTFYFIFISGFLFAYLSHKVSTKRFYINKFKNIVLPYVFLTVTLLLLYANIGTQEDVFSIVFIKSLGDALLFGTASSQFWYIPFILLVFLVAPLFLKLKSNSLKILSLICLFLPMLGTRTGTLLSVGQIIYFLPGFILGIFFAKHYKKTIKFIRKINWVFILVTILTTGFLFYHLYLNQHLVLEKNNMLEAVFYIQKSAILALAFLFFEKIDNV